MANSFINDDYAKQLQCELEEAIKSVKEKYFVK